MSSDATPSEVKRSLRHNTAADAIGSRMRYGKRGRQLRTDTARSASVAEASDAVHPLSSAPKLQRHVPRKALLDALDQAADAKLVTLVAPAGAAKTVTMHQYQNRCVARGWNRGWVTLQPCDDDLQRFCATLAAGMRSVVSEASAPQLEVLLRSALDDERAAAGALRDALVSLGRPFVLFIDCFELITDPRIAQLLRLVLALLPESSQVVLASRRALYLPLGNLRARGQVVELTHSALCFSLTETAHFCDGSGLQPEDIERLHRLTEGWPAMLRFALDALAIAPNPHDFIASFSGLSPAACEFLSEEIFSAETVETQEFLLRASVLAELNAPLGNAVCATSASEDLLRALDRANAYLTALNPERSVFRFHPLMQTYLRRELARRLPSEVRRLHLEAARWFQNQGRIGPAIEHALECGELDYAVDLLEHTAEGLLCQGRSRVLAGWFDRIPAAVLRPHYQLRIVQMWALATIRRSDEALRMIEQMQSELRERASSEEIDLELSALKVCILAVMDRPADGAWVVCTELAKLPARDSVVRRILVTTLAVWKVASNEFAEAIAFGQMYEYRDELGTTRSSYFVTFVEGLVALAQCRVREAIAHLRIAFAGSTRAFRSVTAIYLAEALYEIGELDEARELLDAHAVAIRDFGQSDHLIISHVLRARIAHVAGDVDAAFRHLSDLEHLARQANLPRALVGAQLERARMAGNAGDADSARLHYQRARHANGWQCPRGMTMPANDVETVELCRYRLHVHGIERGDAIAQISADYKTAQAQGRHRRAFRLALLHAKLLHMDGQIRQAMRTLEAALRIAMQEGLTRAFIDEGTPIVELVRVFRVARTPAGEATSDIRLIKFIDEVLAAAGIDIEDTRGRGETAVAADAPQMTARELQILDALASGLSNMKIAELLFVSETTVRSHLRKISVKLGTSSRTQAVCVARRFGLV